MLEMKTYRFSGHSRSDKATYRPDGELDEWLTRDPINLYANVLADLSGTSVESILERQLEVDSTVAEASQIAMSSPEPDVADMFAHVIASSQ